MDSKKVTNEMKNKVLSQVLKGMRSKDIAIELNTSLANIKYHLTGLFKAYEVTNRSQLIAKLGAKMPEILLHSTAIDQVECPVVTEQKYKGN